MITIGNIQLPFDILKKIFYMLPQKDKIKLREVCGDFKRLVDHAHFISRGFTFVIKNDNELKLLALEKMLNKLNVNFHYAPLKAIGVFKISLMAFGNLLNRYESKDLKLSHPESLKILIFGGLILSTNFSIIMNQLTHLNVLTIMDLALKNLQLDHLSGLNFNNLKAIIITSSEIFKNKIKTFLTRNEFPKLTFAKIIVFFEPRPIHDKKITPKEDFQVREKILFPFFKKCQKTIELFDFVAIPFRASDNVLDFNPVEEDENLNLEEYKIFCPLRVFKYSHINGSKIDPWITFLDTNFNNLKRLEWVNKSELQEDLVAFHNLIKSKKWVQLQTLKWGNYSSRTYLSEVDFIFLKNYEFLKVLEIRNFPTGIGENWNFKNLKLIAHFCPGLEELTLGRCRMDSDIIDHLLTGNNLPKLSIVKFLSEWRIVGNGMRVDTFRKVIKEKKIKNLTLMDCLDNESFGQPDNLEFLISQIGQDRMNKIKYSIQKWHKTEFYWKKEDANANNNDN